MFLENTRIAEANKVPCISKYLLQTTWLHVHNQKGVAMEQADKLSSVLITSTEHIKAQVCGMQPSLWLPKWKTQGTNTT